MREFILWRKGRLGVVARKDESSLRSCFILFRFHSTRIWNSWRHLHTTGQRVDTSAPSVVVFLHPFFAEPGGGRVRKLPAWEQKASTSKLLRWKRRSILADDVSHEFLANVTNIFFFFSTGYEYILLHIRYVSGMKTRHKELFPWSFRVQNCIRSLA